MGTLSAWDYLIILSEEFKIMKHTSLGWKIYFGGGLQILIVKELSIFSHINLDLMATPFYLFRRNLKHFGPDSKRLTKKDKNTNKTARN